MKHGYITPEVAQALRAIEDDVLVAKRTLDYMDYDTFQIVQDDNKWWFEMLVYKPIPRYIEQYLTKFIKEKFGLDFTD